MPKRYRAPVAKPGQLLVKYGQEHGDQDLYFCHGGDGASKRDANLLILAFSRDLGNGKSLRQELEARGYDITTLRLSVMHKSATVDPTAQALRVKT